MREPSTSGYMTGLSLGLLGGTVVGIIVDNVGVGAMAGLAVGMLIGNAFDARNSAEEAKRDAAKFAGAKGDPATEARGDEGTTGDAETKGERE